MQQLSSQQAIYICLSLPLFSSTWEHQFINIAQLEDHTLLLKRWHIFKWFLGNSPYIFCVDVVQKYTNQKPHLSNICLADFVVLYNISSAKCSIHTKPTIIKFIKNNKDKESHNYFKEQGSLFLPFKTSKMSHLQPNQTWHNAYTMLVVVIKKKRKNTPRFCQCQPISRMLDPHYQNKGKKTRI